jgi:putative PIN family toxin of toxin-antitoxin system
LVISVEILKEYRRVGEALAERFPSVNLGPVLDLVTAEAKTVLVQSLPGPVCTDPDDDKFLACALAAKCKLIVSGDKHLLKVSGFHGITVMPPRQFVDKHLA